MPLESSCVRDQLRELSLPGLSSNHVVPATTARKQIYNMSIPVAGRSKAKVCGRSLAGIAGSSFVGGMDVCVVCCKESQKTECRTIRTKNQVWMKYRDQENTRKDKRQNAGVSGQRTKYG
jgi:hypothetical protein